MRVAVTARSADQLAETVKLAGPNTIAVTADMADPAAVRAMVREVEKRLGPIDLLVNNAGTAGAFRPLLGNDPQAWGERLGGKFPRPDPCLPAGLPGMVPPRTGLTI